MTRYQQNWREPIIMLAVLAKSAQMINFIIEEENY